MIPQRPEVSPPVFRELAEPYRWARRISPGLLFICLALFRPTLWGGDKSLFGILLMGGFVLFYLLLVPASPKDRDSTRIVIWITVTQFVFWAYCAFLSIFMGDSRLDFMFKGVALGAASALFFGICFSDTDLRDRFFRLFAQINSLLGWSTAVSAALLLVVSPGAITIGHIDIANYADLVTVTVDDDAGNGTVVLPFSVIYSELTEYGLTRFLGMYRESGIAQAFFCWTFFYFLYTGGKNKWYWAFGALLGAFFCGSTTAVLSFGIAFSIYFLFRANVGFGKSLLFIVSMVALAALAIYAPGIGLNDKLTTHRDSLEDREVAVRFALFDNDNIVFGHGMFYRFIPYAGLGINAISYIYFYGLIGLCLYVINYVVFPLLSKRDVRAYIVLLSPFFVCALLFQPLIDAPLIYAMLYCFLPVSTEPTSTKKAIS